MILKAMLWALAKRIETLAKNDEAFKKSIAKKRCVLQFETRDRKTVRHIAFAGGDTQSKAKAHDNPSLTFTFESNKAVRQLIVDMAKSGGDRSAFTGAINQGKIRLRGDVSLLGWFMKISEHLAP